MYYHYYRLPQSDSKKGIKFFTYNSNEIFVPPYANNKKLYLLSRRSDTAF